MQRCLPAAPGPVCDQLAHIHNEPICRAAHLVPRAVKPHFQTSVARLLHGKNGEAFVVYVGPVPLLSGCHVAGVDRRIVREPQGKGGILVIKAVEKIVCDPERPSREVMQLVHERADLVDILAPRRDQLRRVLCRVAEAREREDVALDKISGRVGGIKGARDRLDALCSEPTGRGAISAKVEALLVARAAVEEEGPARSKHLLSSIALHVVADHHGEASRAHRVLPSLRHICGA
mmetsp:Transcript_1311/g.4054  ORF Transcript_1311/g.4054 Transcript_1311/m.4054 type:complete len:234 (+) Transcript_1311:1043-1744(+)